MHMSEAACTLCIPILSLVAWAGEERYDGPLSGARDTDLITSGTHMGVMTRPHTRFHLMTRTIARPNRVVFGVVFSFLSTEHCH